MEKVQSICEEQKYLIDSEYFLSLDQMKDEKIKHIEEYDLFIQGERKGVEKKKCAEKLL